MTAPVSTLPPSVFPPSVRLDHPNVRWTHSLRKAVQAHEPLDGSGVDAARTPARASSPDRRVHPITQRILGGVASMTSLAVVTVKLPGEYRKRASVRLRTSHRLLPNGRSPFPAAVCARGSGGDSCGEERSEHEAPRRSIPQRSGSEDLGVPAKSNPRTGSRRRVLLRRPSLVTLHPRDEDTCEALAREVLGIEQALSTASVSDDRDYADPALAFVQNDGERLACTPATKLKRKDVSHARTTHPEACTVGILRRHIFDDVPHARSYLAQRREPSKALGFVCTSRKLSAHRL